MAIAGKCGFLVVFALCCALVLPVVESAEECCEDGGPCTIGGVFCWANAKDQGGNLIGSYRTVNASTVTSVTLNVSGRSSAAALSNLWLKVWVTANGMETYQEKDCAQSMVCPAGTGCSCTLIVPYGEGTRIKYMGAASKSGTIYESGFKHVSLRNFIAFTPMPRFSMMLGDISMMMIELRNNRELQDNITIMFSGYSYITFLNTTDIKWKSPGEAVVPVAGNTEKRVFAEVRSSMPGTFPLRIYTESLLDEFGGLCSGIPGKCVNETSALEVHIGYSPEFPDMNLAGIALLAVAGALVFAFMRRTG